MNEVDDLLTVLAARRKNGGVKVPPGSKRLSHPRTWEAPDGSIIGTGEMASIDAAIERIIERDGLPEGLRPGDIV